MSYDGLRQLADSWGLAAMVALFLIFVGWAFLPRNRDANRRAAHSIFEDEGRDHG